MHGLLERMKKESDVFRTYYEAVFVDTFDENDVKCNDECKRSYLCAIEHVIYDHFDACFESRDVTRNKTIHDVNPASSTLTSSIVVMLARTLLFIRLVQTF